MTEIETDRLSIRPYLPDEASLIHRLIGDLRIFYWRSEPGTLKEAEDRLQKSLTNHRENGLGLWAVFLKGRSDDGTAFIGQAFLQKLPDSGQIAIGYQLIPDAWGNGYATEAASALLDHGFETFNVDQIVALVLPDNKPSQRVLQRLDLTYIEDRMFADLKHGMYALSREDYLARRNNARQEA